MTLTAERLREVLSYDPLTGVFIWKACTSSSARVQIGETAGWHGDYVEIRIDMQLHKAHRLAWLYVYGEWPTKGLDHIDEDKHNNRIANLREASNSLNGHNQTKPQRNNTSGYRGVSYHKGRKKFQAVFCLNGRHHHLGYFDIAEDASEAYEKARVSLR